MSRIIHVKSKFSSGNHRRGINSKLSIINPKSKAADHQSAIINPQSSISNLSRLRLAAADQQSAHVLFANRHAQQKIMMPERRAKQAA
jgi:hypothetical protein